jgi:C-methyltransferase C-terminal domain/Putative zinc binding domain/Methyltransferase domain
MSPLCESYLRAEQLNTMERFYPLHVDVCRHCWLVQLEQYVSAEHIFSEYAYFSSCAETWVEHARRYAETMIDRFGYGQGSHVVEVASNDGYLLHWFVKAGVPCLGIEPAANAAAAAEGIGVPSLIRFFGVELAHELVAGGRRADLIIANNVLAQVPDLNDFVGGMNVLLAPTGVLTLEFPHVMRLIDQNQFDTIYHEHFGYFSLFTTRAILRHHGLEVFDVDELPTRGGSLRLYAWHRHDDTKPVTPAVGELLKREEAFGLMSIDRYRRFSAQVEETKRGILELLIGLKREGRRIAGYGAPGKGNTLLNYCGIRTDFLDFTVDRSPYKQGMFLPGTHIPILGPEEIDRRKPDYVFILPWNFKDEIMAQMAHVHEWSGHFILPIPNTRIVQ